MEMIAAINLVVMFMSKALTAIRFVQLPFVVRSPSSSLVAQRLDLEWDLTTRLLLARSMSFSSRQTSRHRLDPRIAVAGAGLGDDTDAEDKDGCFGA